MRRPVVLATVVLVVLLGWAVFYRPSLGGQPLARGQIVDVTVSAPITGDCINDASEVPGMDDIPIDERPHFCRAYEVVGISVGDGDNIALSAGVPPDARVMRRVAGGLAYLPLSARALRVGQTVYVWGNGLRESSPPQTDATVVEVR